MVGQWLSRRDFLTEFEAIAAAEGVQRAGAAQKALEAGNSPQIIFFNIYRELVRLTEARIRLGIDPEKKGKIASMPKARQRDR